MRMSAVWVRFDLIYQDLAPYKYCNYYYYYYMSMHCTGTRKWSNLIYRLLQGQHFSAAVGSLINVRTPVASHGTSVFRLMRRTRHWAHLQEGLGVRTLLTEYSSVEPDSNPQPLDPKSSVYTTRPHRVRFWRMPAMERSIGIRLQAHWIL